MSRRDKLIARLKARPKDFAWEELVRLLEGLGYTEAKGGQDGRIAAALPPSDSAGDRPAQTASRQHREDVCHRRCPQGADRGGSDMTSMLDYKGYMGSVEYNDDDEIFHGRLEFIRDLVAYEGADAKSLKRAFHEAVDDYLELCAAEGREPDVPLKGSFNVRSGPRSASARHDFRTPQGTQPQYGGARCYSTAPRPRGSGSLTVRPRSIRQGRYSSKERLFAPPAVIVPSYAMALPSRIWASSMGPTGFIVLPGLFCRVLSPRSGFRPARADRAARGSRIARRSLGALGSRGARLGLSDREALSDREVFAHRVRGFQGRFDDPLRQRARSL